MSPARGSLAFTEYEPVDHRPIGFSPRTADDEYMERALTLTCPQCGTEFSSALQMDAETFTKIRLQNNIERCSQCGYSKRYQKGDYFFV